MKKLQILILVLLSLGSQAQHIFDTDQRLTTQVGIDPATMWTLTYERRLSEVIKQTDLYPNISYRISLPRPDFANSTLVLGGRLPVLRWNKMQMIGGFSSSFGSVATQNFESQKFSIATDLAVGYYGTQGFIAVTAAYDRILSTQLVHSEYYRARFYSDARDGWYKGSGGSFQFGIEGGIVIIDRIDVFTEIKIPSTERLNSMMGSPGHVNFGVGYRF